MRTNIEIDDDLMRQVMKATGATTKKDAVQMAMKFVLNKKKQATALAALWGIAKDDRGWDPPPAKWGNAKLDRDKTVKASPGKAA